MRVPSWFHVPCAIVNAWYLPAENDWTEVFDLEKHNGANIETIGNRKRNVSKVAYNGSMCHVLLAVISSMPEFLELNGVIWMQDSWWETTFLRGKVVNSCSLKVFCRFKWCGFDAGYSLRAAQYTLY